MKRISSALVLLALIAGCSSGGDSGGSGSGGTVVTPTPTATSTPTPTPSPASSPLPPVTGNFLNDAAALYSVQADIAACQQGQLSAAVTADMLARVNEVRALHGLPAVGYSTADEPQAQAAALMMAANGQLSHNPPTSWNCYSSAGAAGAAASNLYGGTGNGLTLLTNTQIVAGWMTEVDNLVLENVGHRRWILDPFLNTIAFGRVAGRWQTSNRADASALRVIGNQGAGPSTASLPAFVAYPYQEYPARYFDTRALLSFGVISNRNDRWGNTNVSFAAASVAVQQRGGGAMTVSRIAFDNDGYGLPNNIQFAVAGLQPNVTYDVTISNVRVAGVATNYNYFFRIVP